MQAAVIDEHIMTEILEKEYREVGEKVPPLRIPKDKFYLCHIVFFLLGIAHFLPISFFNAAMNFWMYKFRNLSDPTMSTGNRTSLQIHFASAHTAVSTVPVLLVGIWNILYAHKYKIMSRINITFLIQVIIYYLFTAFVKINTDSYETGFFVMVMASLATLTTSNIINLVASMLLYPRFPHTYMKTSMIGEGMAGIIGDVLNIISVAVFEDVRDATLMYFLFGSFMITTTLVLTFMISRTEFFKHCLETMPQDHKKGMPERKEIFRVMFIIKATFIISTITIIGQAATHTSVTSLVVSQQNSESTVWATKFFSPVMTFLWADCCGLVGRFLASHSPLQRLPEYAVYIVAIARTVVLVPLIWFCNAQPRNHLSVLFPYDYQYAIILGLFMVIGTYCMNMAMFTVPRKTTKHEAEVAYIVNSLVMGIIAAATSPIGLLVVDIL